MSSSEEKILLEEINAALDFAECTWGKVAKYFTLDGVPIQESVLSQTTQIPGFPFIEDGKPKVSDFIAMFVDIRKSTEHLTQAIKAGASGLERVHYETTALYTVGSLIIKKHNGKVTEFLGDGFLALFNVDKNTEIVYNAHNSAKDCLQAMTKIVNPILNERYGLPNVNIGIGMAYSKALVTLVGHGYKQPKAFGECVYRASKLSDGYNEICIDDRLEYLWPASEGGKLQFRTSKRQTFKSYIIV